MACKTIAYWIFAVREVGKNEGIQAREQKADSKGEKAKGGAQEDGAPKEKVKQCKELATTVDKLDAQLDCAHNHQRKEKGKE